MPETPLFLISRRQKEVLTLRGHELGDCLLRKCNRQDPA